MTDHGKLIRVLAKDIRGVGRSSQGVKLINLDGEDRVSAATLVESESGKVADLPLEGGDTIH